MTTLREAAQQALEALKKNTEHLPVDFDYHFEALAALRAALAEPVQEPGCDHCRSPLWCGTKCKACGRKA